MTEPGAGRANNQDGHDWRIAVGWLKELPAPHVWA